MTIYAIEWRLGYGYDLEREARHFESEEAATRYAKLNFGALFNDDELYNHVTVRPVAVFKMPYWSSLNPYIAIFQNDVLVNLTSTANPRMFEDKLFFETNVYGTLIHFWDSGDIERAKVLAQSMYDGWKYAKELQNDKAI